MKIKHTIEIVNAFRSFHINYIANQSKVIRGVARQFNLREVDIRVIAASVDLLDSLREGRRYNYVTGERIAIWLGYSQRPMSIYYSLTRLCEAGYFSVKEFRINKRGVTSKRYTLNPKAYLICEEYSMLMIKWYSANYFSRKVDKELKDIYGLMGFNRSF